MFVAPLAATESAREFVPSSRYDSFPSFSPDGQMVAFYSNRSGEPEIWVANRDGSGLRRVTNHARVHSGPVWSPDGARLMYAGERALDVVSVSGGRTAMTDIGDVVRTNLAWSADGRSAVFTSPSGLWRVTLDDGKRRRLRECCAMSLVQSQGDGSLYFTSFGKSIVLYRIPAEGGPASVVEENLAVASIAATSRSLYLVRSDRFLYALPFSGGPATKIGRLPGVDGERIQRWETRFTLSPDDSSIIWTLAEMPEADLEILRP
jgi:Tol biopolymer transport system component